MLARAAPVHEAGHQASQLTPCSRYQQWPSRYVNVLIISQGRTLLGLRPFLCAAREFDEGFLNTSLAQPQGRLRLLRLYLD